MTIAMEIINNGFINIFSSNHRLRRYSLDLSLILWHSGTFKSSKIQYYKDFLTRKME